MRLALAIALGAVAAALIAWWLSREAATTPAPTGATANAGTAADRAPALYRWRDDAGVLQITDRPPQGRAYETVDVASLERRNVLDPQPGIDASGD